MTRWSLFLQTLSLLHHFLGLYSLEKAVATLRNTSSFGFVERWSESIAGISLELGETGFEATGNYQSPDRFTKRALVSEFPVQPASPARSINVGEERYLIDPATGEWMLFHDDLGLGQIYRESLFRNPVDLFSAYLLRVSRMNTRASSHWMTSVSTTSLALRGSLSPNPPREGVWLAS